MSNQQSFFTAPNMPPRPFVLANSSFVTTNTMINNMQVYIPPNFPHQLLFSLHQHIYNTSLSSKNCSSFTSPLSFPSRRREQSAQNRSRISYLSPINPTNSRTFTLRKSIPIVAQRGFSQPPKGVPAGVYKPLQYLNYAPQMTSIQQNCFPNQNYFMRAEIQTPEDKLTNSEEAKSYENENQTEENEIQPVKNEDDLNEQEGIFQKRELMRKLDKHSFTYKKSGNNIFEDETESPDIKKFHAKKKELFENKMMKKIKKYVSRSGKDFHSEKTNLPGFNKFAQIYNEQLEKEQNFIDPDFPPNIWSLIEKENSNKSETWANVMWARPQDFLEGEYYLFHSGNGIEEQKEALISLRHKNFIKRQPTQEAIGSDDIVQGLLGDCYFLSSLSSLSLNPLRIRKLFISKQINEKCGIYCVKICHEGEWQSVYIDDYFPVFNDGSGPCFSKSKKGDNELWVPILEKVWAKLYGNYERIEAGLTREVLRDLTGAPTKILWTDQPDLWKEIMNAEAQDWIITAGAVDSQKMEEIKMHDGMVVGHAYSIISAVKWNNNKLINLRNPWGKGEWQGAWSDDDPVWNTISEEEKKLIGYDHEDDGCFFMALDDFVKIYDCVQVCMIDDGKKYDSIKLKTKKGKAVCVEVNVKKEGDYIFTLLQPSTRKINLPLYDYGKSRIIVAKIENDKLEFIDASQGFGRENYINVSGMKPGNYLIYCKVFFEGTKEGTFVLSSYGIDHVSLNSVPKAHDLLERIFYARREKNTPEQAYSLVPHHGYGCYVIENNADSPKKINITFKKLIGLKLRKYLRKLLKGNSLEMDLKAKSKETILLKLESLPGEPIEFDAIQEIL